MLKLLLTIATLLPFSVLHAQDVNVTAPRLVVYKTKKDYSNLVPVTLSQDKSKIVSYPGPVDIKVAGGYLKPSKLKKRYLLDNQGISADVAFLSITYEEYAKMNEAPSRDELYGKIADFDPLLEIYECGERKGVLSDVIKNINKSIKKKRLSNCNKIK